jgi:prophage regulatory protein
MVTKALLRLSEVEHKIGWSRSTIYNWLSKNSPYFDSSFPAPIKFKTSSRWLASAIDDWILQHTQRTPTADLSA